MKYLDVILLPVKWVLVVLQERNFKRHQCGRSLSVVVRFIGVKGNSTPLGCRRWAVSRSHYYDLILDDPSYVYFLGLGNEHYCFQIIQPTSWDFPGHVLDSTLYCPLPWTFQGSLASSYLIFPHIFSGQTLPLDVTISVSTDHASVLMSCGFYCTCVYLP